MVNFIILAMFYRTKVGKNKIDDTGQMPSNFADLPTVTEQPAQPMYK